MSRGRKTADYKTIGNRGRGRPGVWDALRKLKSATVRDLTDRVDLHQKSVQDYLTGLVNAGYLEVAGGKGQNRRYQMLRAGSVHAPRVRKDGTTVVQGQANLNMWRAMKMIKTFDAKDLAIAASTKELECNVETAKNYCQFLKKAGYLNVVEPGGPNRLAKYRFARYTGPRAPQIQRVKQVFDPNTGRVVWSQGNDQ